MKAMSQESYCRQCIFYGSCNVILKDDEDECGDKAMESSGPYYVTYRNEGRPEKTRIFQTRKEAEESRDFLIFQGATGVRVREGR